MVLKTKHYYVSKLSSGERMVKIVESNVAKRILKMAQDKLSAIGGSDVRIVVTSVGMEMMLRKARIEEIEFKRAGAYITLRCRSIDKVSPVMHAPKLRMWE
jgi:hypothetical protein